VIVAAFEASVSRCRLGMLTRLRPAKNRILRWLDFRLEFAIGPCMPTFGAERKEEMARHTGDCPQNCRIGNRQPRKPVSQPAGWHLADCCYRPVQPTTFPAV